MKKFIALSLGIILTLGIIGCGKDKPSDDEQVDSTFRQNEWFTSLGETQKTDVQVQTYGTYGDTSWDVSGCWKRAGSDSSDWDIKISQPGHAYIPISLWWYDTLFVTYDSAGVVDTVAKPAPVFRADVTFYYKNETGEWEFEGLTPAVAGVDSAHPYVNIDSIKIENLTHTSITYPTLKDPTLEITTGASYPYTFHKNDQIKVKVYESGTSLTRWMLLFAPAPDSTPAWFGYSDAEQCWQGIWTVKKVGHHWAWIDNFDLATILDRNITHEREMLWGLPYKVVE